MKIELSGETKKRIKKSIKETKKGKTISHEEIINKLNL